MKKIAYIISLLLLASCVAPTHKQIASPKKTDSSAPLIAEKEITPSHGLTADVPAVKVALLLPLSGESAAIGSSMLDAATLAVYDTYLTVPTDQIHAQITLVPKDTGNNPAETAKAAKQAIEQGTSFVIGPLFSQSVATVAPITKAKNIGVLSFSNNKAVASAGVYTFGFMPEQQIERIADYAYLNQYKRVALLAPNDAYGEKVRDTLSEIYKKKGGVISSNELYAPSSANIDAAVERIAAAYNNAPNDRKFQAIFIADAGNQLRNILKALSKNNIDLKKIKLLGTGLWDDKDIIKIPEMRGAWFSSSPPAQYAAFEKRFINNYGHEPVRLASLAYDAVSIVAQIAMKGEGINAAALSDPRGFESPANGLVRLSSTGKSDRKLVIMEVTAQGFKVIDQAPKSFNDE